MRWERFEIRLAKMLDARLGSLIGVLGLFLQFAPKKRTKPLSVQKILFIKFWGMGSIILSEPALRWLKETYPGVEVHYLTLERNRELFVLIPCVEKVHCLPFGGPFRFLLRSVLLVRQLRRERYNLVFDSEFFANFSALLARLAKGDQVVGFAQAKGVKKQLLHVSIPFSNDLHTAEQFLRLVQKQSMARGENPEPRLLLAEKDLIGKCHPTNRRPYVVMNINASPLAVERRWPRERFAELARALLESYSFDLVLIGSRSEIPYVASLEKELRFSKRVRNCAGKLSVVRLAHLIRGALLIISNDSGPLHMAAALQVPVVGFYGPETPLRYGPLSTRRLVFYRGLWCSPCMSLDNAKTVNCINNLACMKQIETDDVIRDVFSFIDREIGDQMGRGQTLNFSFLGFRVTPDSQPKTKNSKSDPSPSGLTPPAC
ncbi:glycosyltransferase family 9 protein [Acidobacteria bacterium AH-259-G07]|nr:glycosyltransferase family 9 protein [Acidobacteria bacterium AH-259-G07]